MNRSLRKPDRRLGFPLRPFTNQPLPVLLPRTSKAYMGRFSETWQHPAIYNLIDHSSNLLSTCSQVRPIFITRSAFLHLVGDSAQRFSPAPHVVGGSPAELQCHGTGDLMDGAMPLIEVEHFSGPFPIDAWCPIWQRCLVEWNERWSAHCISLSARTSWVSTCPAGILLSRQERPSPQKGRASCPQRVGGGGGGVNMQPRGTGGCVDTHVDTHVCTTLTPRSRLGGDQPVDAPPSGDCVIDLDAFGGEEAEHGGL